ncbi:hypothetical protein L484_023242 [Morus notabilis]|uniref:Gamma-glutamylcyclotransferase family protein n=1 Tax=Morus notabilis TaxID=981085 RepID=W9RYW6_9ROSA|nr:hypothetical protein L484_023242 [Morus notabilis]
MLRIFVYGTLKRGFSNHALMRNPISHNDAAFIGTYRTLHAYPPVRDGVPYLINLPGRGHRIRGELYTVTGAGLEPLDDLEGVAVAHYDRYRFE